MDTEQQIGAHLRRWRILLDLPQELVAARAGISRDSLRRLEKGEGAKLSTVLAVADVLGITERLVHAVDPLETDLGRARSRVTERQRARRLS